MDKSELKAMLKEIMEEEKENKGSYMKSPYGEIRKKYAEKIKEANGRAYMGWKVIESIRDIAKADAGVSYITKATQKELSHMAEVYEHLAKAYLEFKEANNG